MGKNIFVDPNFLEDVATWKNITNIDDINQINNKLIAYAISGEYKYGGENIIRNVEIKDSETVDLLEELGYIVTKRETWNYDIRISKSPKQIFGAADFTKPYDMYKNLVRNYVSNIINQLKGSNEVCIVVDINNNQLRKDVISVLEDLNYAVYFSDTIQTTFSVAMIRFLEMEDAEEDE